MSGPKILVIQMAGQGNMEFGRKEEKRNGGFLGNQEREGKDVKANGMSMMDVYCKRSHRSVPLSTQLVQRKLMSFHPHLRIWDMR
jgi:hypothetical protein